LTHCPAHADDSPSLSITESQGKVLVSCQAGCAQAAVIDALRAKGLWPKSTPTSTREPITTYDYTDADGQLVYQVVRKPGKQFQQRRPNGNGGWVWNLDGVRRVPYRLPELLAAPAEEWVFVVEGEKDTDNLVLQGLVATTNSGGAGKWPEDCGSYFKDRWLGILADNDKQGHDHAQDVAAKLAGHAAGIVVVELPDLPEKGDVSDWLAAGHTVGELEKLVETAPLYEAASPADALMEPVSIDLGDLLDDAVALIRRYVILKDEQADALALWSAHTHAMEAAEATPYISVNSPEKRSGKSRTLETLSLLVPRPWLTGRVTAAVLVRKLATQQPVLLLDESDAAFKAEKEYAAALQAILNSGYRRGGCASLCVKAGGDFELKDFPVFGAKAIAGIGKLPDTIADRAIAITLKRRAPNEPVTRFRWRDAEEEAQPIRELLASWAAASTDALTEARPDLPSELDDRAADVWEPLLAIADLAGGGWPGRARRAALALSVGSGKDDDSLGVRLLGDIRAVFGERGVDRIPTAELIKALLAMDEAPWGDLYGKALDARGLARRLRPYGVRSHNIRLPDGTVPKGYELTDLEDTWARYCMPEKSATSATSATPGSAKYDTDAEGVAHVADVADFSGIQEPTDNSPGHLAQYAVGLGAKLVEKDGAKADDPDALVQKIAEVLKAKGPSEDGSYAARCPFAEGNGHGGFSFDGRGYACQTCGSGGPIGRLAQRLGIASMEVRE
jgi:hypothetical protein